MENLIKEDIDRINELMRLTEEDTVGDYIDSTYLKTSGQAGISDEETNRMVTKTIQDAIDNNMKLVMILPEYVGLAKQMIKDGVLNNPKVTNLFGQHVLPDLEVGKVGFKAGMYMASTDELHIKVDTFYY